MAPVRPAAARLVRPSWAARVASPLHDALDPVTRATILATNPDSWLHVARRADDQAWLDPHEVAQRSAAALQRLLEQDAYSPSHAPTYFIYRYHDHHHAQLGLVAHVPIEAFLSSEQVLGHEHVEAHRVRALVAHQRHLSMRGDLVALLMPDDLQVDALLTEVSSGTPEVEIPGDLSHEIWRVGHEFDDRITALLAPLPLYIVDGHHRVAAAIEEWRAAGQPIGYGVLCLITPQSQLRALSFDRRIVGPIPDPLALLTDRFTLRALDHPERRAGSVGVYVDGQWYALDLPASDLQGVAALDVIRLHREVIEPVFGIQTWGDPRLEVTSERVAVDVLQYRCDNDGGVACILKAPSVAAIVDVARRHEQMPPKSTYFDPKPWSGVFIAPPQA